MGPGLPRLSSNATVQYTYMYASKSEGEKKENLYMYEKENIFEQTKSYCVDMEYVDLYLIISVWKQHQTTSKHAKGKFLLGFQLFWQLPSIAVSSQVCYKKKKSWGGGGGGLRGSDGWMGWGWYTDS